MDRHFSDLLRILKNRKNQTHFLPTLNRNLTPLCRVQINVSI